MRIPLALALLIAVPAPAQVRITKSRDLRFGTLVSGAGAGSLTLDPDGKVQADGLYAGQQEPRGPAVFLLEGPAHQPFTVELAARVFVPRPQGDLILERFQPALRTGDPNLAFNGDGQAELRVGATLRAPGPGTGVLPGHQMELKVTCRGASARALFQLQGRVLRPLQVQAAGALEFGRFLVPAAEAQVTLDPGRGARTLDGGGAAVLIGRAGAPGRFRIEGEPWAKVSVELPSVGRKWFLKGPGEPIEIFQFRTDPASDALSLDGNGKGLVKVGASLRLGRDQKPGAYEAYYTVVFNYP